MAKADGQQKAAPVSVSLPHDIEAERQMLATMCAPGAEAVAIEVRAFLEPDDFFHPGHILMFEAVGRLLDKHMEIHPVAIRDEMGNDARRVGGFAGIVEILQGDEAQKPMELAQLLRREKKRRSLIKLGNEMMRAAAQEEDEPEMISERAVKDLYVLGAGDSRRSGLIHVDQIEAEVIEGVVERVDAITTGSGAGIRQVPTGFQRLDEAMAGGFEPGQLIILAARPGVGKSTLVGNWVLNALASSDDPIAIFNLEMGRNEVWQRLISSGASMDMRRILSPRAITHDTSRLVTDAATTLRGRPLYIADDAVVTVPFIQAQLTQLMNATGRKPRLAVVDYLQLLSSPDSSRAAKQNEAVRIGEISRGLKLTAKEFDIPLVVLSQLNREVEHRATGRPQLSDLRDSGAIEQDADIVAFIHRRMTPGVDTMDETAEVFFAKHRNGPLIEQQVKFHGEHFTFEEVVRETASYH
jgi:replicative DNA helicase